MTPPTHARTSRRRLRILTCIGATLAVVIAATPSAATNWFTQTDPTTPKNVRMAVNVLVINDGNPSTEAVRDRLRQEGVPLTVIDLRDPNRRRLTPSLFARTGDTTVNAAISGIVTGEDQPAGLSADERTLMKLYCETFGVRRVLAQSAAGTDLGLDMSRGFTGEIDGVTATATAEARKGSFSYLRGPVQIDNDLPDVLEVYANVGVPTAPSATYGTYTSFLDVPIPGSTRKGSIMGSFVKDGVEKLVITSSYNTNQRFWNVLGTGVVRWLTRDIALSHNRNYFSVHIDDVLAKTGMWSPEGKCTITEDCDPVKFPFTMTGADARMVPKDVTDLAAWQRKNNFKLDMALNGAGRDAYMETNGGKDPLTDAFVKAQADFRWINHTYTHAWLGCERNITLEPFSYECKRNDKGIEYVTHDTIKDEISRNNDLAGKLGLKNYHAAELVTGEHSGLKSPPSMLVDNPNLATAFGDTGVKWVASDASRESASRMIGPARTVPRYPMNIYYNAGTKAQANDEYTWLYSSSDDGGSGNCARLGYTCMPPLRTDADFDRVLVPAEVNVALRHVVSNDPRPHYAHQLNIAMERILLPVVERTIAQYRQTFADSAPLINPIMSQAGYALNRQELWSQYGSAVKGYIQGNTLTIANGAAGTIHVPVTTPEGTTMDGKPFGASYGGVESDWVPMTKDSKVSLTLPESTGYVTQAAWNLQDDPSMPTPIPTSSTFVPPAPTTTTFRPTVAPSRPDPANSGGPQDPAHGLPPVGGEVTTRPAPTSTVLPPATEPSVTPESSP